MLDLLFKCCSAEICIKRVYVCSQMHVKIFALSWCEIEFANIFLWFIWWWIQFKKFVLSKLWSNYVDFSYGKVFNKDLYNNANICKNMTNKNNEKC